MNYYPPVYDFCPQSPSFFGRWLKKIEYHFFFRRQYLSQARLILRKLGVPSAKGLKMLDVGCGHGLRMKEFVRLGFKVYGSDISASAVSYVRQGLGLEAVESDSADLSNHHKPESLDIVTSFYMIEHVPEVQKSLEVFNKLVKPGGTLVLATLLIDSQQSHFWGKRWAGVTEAPRHLTLPSEKGLRYACQAAGFTRVRLVPDSVLACTGVWMLSLFPVLGRRHMGSAPRWDRLAIQLLAAIMSLLVMPWCWIENHVLRRPALVFVFAGKR